MTRLAAVDAQTYWMSTKIPNDQFVLYGFGGVPGDLEGALASVRRNASDCPELLVRIDDSDRRRYPAWVQGEVGEGSYFRHELEDGTWSGCLQAVSALVGDQLDATLLPWRLHLFSNVDGVPGVSGAGTVAVVQISHALGDGNRSSALAG
ncbi:MAG: DUF1298 domain-containing protein, partial [Mycobacterium sp.]|nr:DUF1298 domain-containing protein [Mycobacterium sp.]